MYTYIILQLKGVNMKLNDIDLNEWQQAFYEKNKQAKRKYKMERKKLAKIERENARIRLGIYTGHREVARKLLDY